MRGKLIPMVVVVAATAGMALAPLAAASGRKIKNGPVDEATLHVDSISKETPLRVRAFSVSDADMGKPKHRDTAKRAARHVAGLLALDLVESLREAGFRDVAFLDAGDALPSSYTLVEGAFTQLDAGSQTQRVLWGFGAGKSKVCVAGQVKDDSGKLLGDFKNCRKGLGWGSGEGQMEGDAREEGSHIAAFLSSWANGDLSH